MIPVSIATDVAYVGALALLVAAPFEMREPLVRLPWQSISSLELVVLAVFAAWGVALAASRRWPSWPGGLTLPWAALLAAMLVAALRAPAARVNALHMVARMTLAFGLAALAASGFSSSARIRRGMDVALAAGVVVAVLGVLEYLQVAPVLAWLRAFRPDVIVVGAQIRAGGPLQYPTIASMFLEIVFALGLGALVTHAAAGRRGATVAAFAACALVGEAIMLTFTRAGLVTMVLSLALVAGIRVWRAGADAGVRWIAALGVLLLVLFVSSRSAQAMWLRLTSEGQESWYRARIEAPADLALGTGAVEMVTVQATNTGRLSWDSRADSPFYLSYHWLGADGSRVVSFEGTRNLFAEPVPPGSTATVPVEVRAPRVPGRYRLAWDIVQEERLWFSTEPGATTTFTDAIVSGPAAVAPRSLGGTPLPRQAVRPGRVLLWSAAARMLRAHPIFGVGPDNFRLTYGPYAGLADADPRMHSNNMYVEILAGGGIAAGLALLWLLWKSAGALASAAQASAVLPCAIGAAAAGLAVFVHGLVDSFLSFTPTYVVIALALGLVVACGRVPEKGSPEGSP